jgi:ketol-acid reductoisomerase
MHELKLIVDLMYRGGLNFMRFSVSDTAEYGDYVSGPRVTEGAKAAMQDVLTDIQSGAFAAKWIAVQEAGGEDFRRLRDQDKNHQIEQVGADLRAKMPFLKPVVVEAGQAQAVTDAVAAGGER